MSCQDQKGNRSQDTEPELDSAMYSLAFGDKYSH
eukprot:COSAG01_NODE_38851_length_484_cov_1.054545_1_plen_33_part_10